MPPTNNGMEGSTRFIHPDELLSHLRAMHSKMAVTVGRYELVSDGLACDFEWNHMDQAHRPVIHRTYRQAVRLCTGRSFQVSVTKFGRLPIYLPVTDVRIAPGLFYQTYAVFNIILVVSVIRIVQEDAKVHQKVEWYIASSRWLKFLHPLIQRKLRRLNRVQNDEDAPIRARRHQLRQKGFCFKSDSPDFLSSNTPVSEMNVVLPETGGEYRFSLVGVSSEKLSRLSAGPIDLLVRRDDGAALLIWPSVCPHEGGPLEEGVQVHPNTLQCPWHARKVAAVRLSQGAPEAQVLDLKVTLKLNELVVSRS